MKEALLLTDVELELMSILWRLSAATVREVMSELPRGRDLAYTSVSTVLRILEQKGFVRSVPDGKRHIYSARVSKKAYEARNIGHLVRGLFGGDPEALARSFIEHAGLDKDELRALRALLDERLKS